MTRQECQRCAELVRVVVVHPFLKDRSKAPAPVLWCRRCIRAASAERRFAARRFGGDSRMRLLELADRYRRAAEGPAYVASDPRQTTMEGT